MVEAEKETNDLDGESCLTSGLVVPKAEEVKENGIAIDRIPASSGSRDGLVTYKRRKTAKVVENGTIRDDSVTQLDDKSMKHMFDQACQKRSHDLALASDDCSLKLQRNTVLEQIWQSLESESDLTKFIQDALLFHPGTGSKTISKESVHSCEDKSKCTLQTGSAREGFQNVAKTSVGVTSTGSVNQPNHGTVKDLCRCTFSDIIMSENFAQLCRLLLENFQGMKANKLFDLSQINSRMKERAYENSPVLLHSDIQQIWTKLQKVGADMFALAKCLSDKTTTSFHEQVGSSAHSISEDGKHEFHTQESDIHTKEELKEAYTLNKVNVCKHCGENTEGRNSLVCDLCEEMYHISCIKPAVKEIPVRSWYCANCTTKGIESSHDHCIACERLNPARSSNEEDELLHEESSNEVVENEGDKSFLNCKACRNEVRNEEEYRMCGHPFCPHKFYHVRCLTKKQLISYGPCWYCPSCLCRTCFTDRDDDKIVLCDGCDHAYHIYCMNPPRTAIPKRNWFCKRCDVGIQRIRKAKRSYENMKGKSKKIALDGKLKSEEGSNKSGGMDMLLNAAKTLNYEENLAAMARVGPTYQGL
ncbi:hypothetical protein ACJIZ3_002887 [Penstemon smallii]|uniref:PHD-type domain-containing protein n=1 Tax=Penstemon smallii TaxID=265156 RepID=A0ABD3U7N1_9LAMI